jgi:hypothetical protein
MDSVNRPAHVIYRYLDAPLSDELEDPNIDFSFTIGDVINRHGTRWLVKQILTEQDINRSPKTHTIWVCLVKAVVH